MITHHHGVLQEQKVGAPPELFNFGEGPRWGSLCPNRDQLRELKVVLTHILSMLGIGARLSADNKMKTRETN